MIIRCGDVEAMAVCDQGSSSGVARTKSWLAGFSRVLEETKKLF